MAKKGKKKPRSGGRPPARPQASRARSGPQRSADADGTATATKSTSGRARPTRAERLEAARRARRRKSLMVRLAVSGVAAAVILGLAVRALSGRSEADETRDRLTAGSCSFDTRADRTDPAPRDHVANPRYRVDPPAGGNHSPQAARPGIYREGDVPPDGQLVHALEHGYVVLWHRPGLSEQDRNVVRDVAQRFERDVLVVPRPSLRTPVAATAWGRRLLCRGVEADALDLFVRTYRNQGPERVPH